MDFLDQVYFDNTLKSYFIVLGIVLVVMLFRKPLSHGISSLFYLLIKRRWKSIEKREFTILTIRPLSWLLVVIVSVFALDKLTFPSALDFKIYGHSSEEITARLGITIIIVMFIWFVLSLIDFIALLLKNPGAEKVDKGHDQVVVFFRDFLKVVIGIIGALMIIKAALNQDIGSVLTGLSIVGAALALAGKESLENLIASFIIFFDKPFFTGDTVKVNNVSGTVEKIGLRSTRIRTAEKTLVTVPNKQMVDSVVDNLSMRSQRRAEMKLELSEKTSLEAAETFTASVSDMIKSKKDKIQNFTIYISEYSKNGITTTLEFFTSPIPLAEFNRVKQEVNIELIKLMKAQNLEFPSSSASVNIFNNEADAGAPKNNNSII